MSSSSRIARFGRFAVVFGVLALALSAQASTTASTGAKRFQTEDSNCFSPSETGQILQACTGTPTVKRTWCVSDSISSSGTKSVVVNARQVAQNDQDNLMSCFARGVTQQGGLFSSSSVVNWGGGIGSDQNMPTMNVAVPSFGSIIVCCDMPGNARWNTVNF